VIHERDLSIKQNKNVLSLQVARERARQFEWTCLQTTWSVSVEF